MSASRRIAAIPGVGVLTATAAVAMMGDPAAFRIRTSEFAASEPVNDFETVTIAIY